MGQKGTIAVETQSRTKGVFWGLAARCYQLRIINQLRQFAEYITKILDSKREMWAQGEPIKKPSVSPKRLQLWATRSVNLQKLSVFPKRLMKNGVMLQIQCRAVAKNHKRALRKRNATFWQLDAASEGNNNSVLNCPILIVLTSPRATKIIKCYYASRSSVEG